MRERFSRREFFWPVLPGMFLVACGDEFQTIIYQKDQAKRKEDKSPIIRQGDFVISKDKAYLERSRVSEIVHDPAAFLRNTKWEQYGGRVLRPTEAAVRDMLDKWPAKEMTNFDLFDPFSGQLRAKLPNGGEIILYFPGFLTQRGFPLDSVFKKDNEGFVKIREKLELEKFLLHHSGFYTYGAYDLSEFKAEDTFRPVDKNIFYAITFLDVFQRYFPFAQFNIIAHSLGGILALYTAMEHMDIINNLILIDVPFGGIDVGSDIVKKALDLNPFGENPITFLSDLYNDEEEKERIQNFGQVLTDKGKGFVVISSQGDPITHNSREIRGARVVVLKGGTHGSAVRSFAAHNVITSTIGENRAAA